MATMDWREVEPEIVDAALAAAVNDADTGWSLGTFGALAEFHRAPGAAARIAADESGWRVATELGALRVERDARARLLPYEMLSKTATAWSQGVLVCLPADAADVVGADGLGEVGAEAGGRLFDLGLGVAHLKPCLRSDDDALIAQLRGHAGKSFLELPAGVTAAIKAAQPTRVFISALGRIEVLAEIPQSDGTTPLGPHTHVMPELLAKGLSKGRGQSANIDVPAGWVAALAFYPPNPIRDAMGDIKPFDAAAHANFQNLVERFAPAEIVAAKRLARDALAAGRGPYGATLPKGRAARTALRVALRQWYHTDGPSPAWRDWVEACDPVAARQPAAG